MSLCDRLRAELDRMEGLGAIKSDWVNSIVCVNSKKNYKLHVCMDPKDPNTNIKRELTRTKYIPKMDASHGFWQLKIDEENVKRFTSPHSAPEIFHSAMEQMIEGLVGVRVYVDDLVIWGSTQK